MSENENTEIIDDNETLQIPSSILFVDDEDSILRTLKRTMRKYSEFKCFFSVKVSEAKQILKEHDIDIIVSDFSMPEMDGITFLKFVKNNYPRIISMLLTGQATLDTAQQAINEVGLFSLLIKPWNSEELYNKLKQAKTEAKRKKILTSFQYDLKDDSIDLKKIYLLFAEWDEDFGPTAKYISLSLGNTSVEQFTTHTFMTFSSIYGNNWKGKREIINLPIDYLNLQSRIYFDYIETKEVRGGRKPIMLGVFMPNIPSVLEPILDGIVPPTLTKLIVIQELEKNEIENECKIMLEEIKLKITQIVNLH